jgi:hypothetical protein
MSMLWAAICENGRSGQAAKSPVCLSAALRKGAAWPPETQRPRLTGEMKNPIISELRRIRDAHAERCNHNVQAMARELMELEPWMERRTYTLHQGKLVLITRLHGKKRGDSRTKAQGTIRGQ